MDEVYWSWISSSVKWKGWGQITPMVSFSLKSMSLFEKNTYIFLSEKIHLFIHQSAIINLNLNVSFG